MSLNNNDAPQYEICVMCGETTKVLIDTPIDCRKFYIHGCGQVCENCANVLRHEEEQKHYKNVVSDIEMETLLAEIRKNGKGD